MTIEEFWNHAFLAALSRLPVDEAKGEADKATEKCISHWRSKGKTWAPDVLVRWQDQDIASIRFSRRYAESPSD